MDPAKRIHTFEILGYDFMLDSKFKVYLIEVNTNPCLEITSPLLGRITPRMIDNAIRIAIDPIFPPPEGVLNSKKFLNSEPLCENHFILVFDEKVDGPQLSEYFSNLMPIKVIG